MIRKYIENTEEIQQRLTEMLMEDAKEMCGNQRDIYMYIDEDGQARLEWFENPGGNSWLDDDHILLHVCPQHREGIEGYIDDAAPDYADQADEIIRAFCRCSIDDALASDESIGDPVPIVWLFEIDY